MSKVIRDCFGFTLLRTLSDWCKNTRATYATNQRQNQSRFGRTRFPALGAGYVYLLRVLIGSLCCLCLPCLPILTILVLVLRHSFENRCNDSQRKSKVTMISSCKSDTDSSWFNVNLCFHFHSCICHTDVQNSCPSCNRFSNLRSREFFCALIYSSWSQVTDSQNTVNSRLADTLLRTLAITDKIQPSTRQKL